MKEVRRKDDGSGMEERKYKTAYQEKNRNMVSAADAQRSTMEY